MAQATPQNQYDVLAQVGDVGGVLSMYYVFIGCLLLGIAYFLIDHTAPRLGGQQLSWNNCYPSIIFYLIILLINVTNLRVIYADIAFKNAEPFVSSNQWKMATYIVSTSS